MARRVTQDGAEFVVQADDPSLEVTQNAAEAIVLLPEDTSALQVTQNAAEPLVLFNPSPLRVTATGLDIFLKPLPEEPPPPPETTLEACDLILQVFNDDRETIRWSAATSLIYSNPFLVMPDRYAEQELDAATCSASLGTVTCTVVDYPQEPGDQDGGFMTGKLAYQALADIAGRRSRLLRAIGEQPETTLEVVIDGVAGTPRMDPSYAAFGFDIRDWREVERKIRCFSGSTDAAMGYLPNKVLHVYGFNPDTNQYILSAAPVIQGTFVQDASRFPNPSTGSVDVTGWTAADRTIPLAVHQQLFGQTTESSPEVFLVPLWERVRFYNVTVWWRVAGSGDPFSIIDGAHLVLDMKAGYPRYNLATVTTDLGNDLVRVDTVSFGDDRIAPAGTTVAPYSPVDPEAALPPDGTLIEFQLIHTGLPSTDIPVLIDGIAENLTAGQFAKNVYDGLYSARDPDGNVVPTGIRYDEDALLQMTDIIRLRLFEPITDARDWLEKYIYAPTGWIPALDRFGRISPVSQTPPDDIFSLPLIWDAITEPAPDWDAGRRIVNIVRFTYPRDYVPFNPDDVETGDGLADIDVVLEFQDPVSVDRHGPQIVELDGRAFRAIGTTGDGASIPDGNPLSAGLTAELGYQLAQDRQLNLLPRYSLGAPMFTLNVRREFTPTLRAGSWTRVWLSWLPDYVTNRRELIALCQVVAIGDLDCVWRRVTFEQVLPLGLYEPGEDVRAALLIGKSGKILTGNTGNPLIATF
jgi:hypothetical protein